MTPAGRYTRKDFGPCHRWTVFLCEREGHPQHVAYEPGEGDGWKCRACGAGLVAVVVAPVEDDDS